MVWYLLFVLKLLLVINIYDTFASSFEALRRLQEINRALKGTVERMKEEGTLNSTKENKELVEKRFKSVFQEELEKAKREGGDLSRSDDPFIEQGLSLCEQMKKRKEELSASAGKKILTGALVGAGIGAVAAGRDRRSEGAIVGAIAGVIAATAHELWTKKDLFEESPEKVAKRVKYSPEKGVHLKITKLDFNKKSYKDNEDARLILRVELLTPDYRGESDDKPRGIFGKLASSREVAKELPQNNTFYDIKIEAFLIRDNKEVFIAEETYSIPMGSYPFLYVFPMCPVIPKGTYELKFKVTHGEVSDEKVISFEKI